MTSGHASYRSNLNFHISQFLLTLFCCLSAVLLCSVHYMAFTWIITYLTDAFLFGPFVSYAVSIENEKARI